MNKSQAAGYKIGIEISRKFWQESLAGRAILSVVDIRDRLFPRYAKLTFTLSVAWAGANRHAWEWVQENFIEDEELFRLFEVVRETLKRVEEDTDVMRSAFISTGSRSEAMDIMFGFMEQRVREAEAGAESVELAQQDESTLAAVTLVKALERWATTAEAKRHPDYERVCGLIAAARSASGDEELRRAVSLARQLVYGL